MHSISPVHVSAKHLAVLGHLCCKWDTQQASQAWCSQGNSSCGISRWIILNE